MDDKQLRQAVIDELGFEPGVKATQIGVAAQNGVVTLTGHVGSYSERFFAEKAVRRVKGVRAIAAHIEVREPSGWAVNDDEIARKALNLIDRDADIPNDIRVKVENGEVTLTGAVNRQFQRQAAGVAMRTLAGVRSVLNLIEVRPQVPPSDVKQRIEDALKRSARI